MNSPLLKWQMVFLVVAILIGLLWACGSSNVEIEVVFRKPSLTALSAVDQEGTQLLQQEMDFPYLRHDFSLPIKHQRLPVIYLTTQSADSALSRVLLRNHGEILQIKWETGLPIGQKLYWDLNSNEITVVGPYDASLRHTTCIDFSELPVALQSHPGIDFLYAFVTALISQQLLLLLSFWLKRRFSQIIWH
jgi:hypothetical protein